MKILGITDMQTSGAAIIEDRRILAAVNEERLVRKKMARGFPRRSIAAVMELSGVKPEEIEAVAVAQINGFFSDEVLEWKGWFEERRKAHNIHAFFFRLASRFGWLAGAVPALRDLFYLLRSPAYLKRRARIKAVLQNEFGIKAPISYYHHHFCHATAAYCTSGFKDALVVSMDGGGDKHSSHVYSVKNGEFKKVNEVGAYDSLGNYYAYVTAICGYKAKKHEGKITGLAAYGKPEYLDILTSLIKYEDGRTKNVGQVLFNTALKRMTQLLPPDFSKENLSSSIQLLSEDITSRYVDYWARQTGQRQVAVAGGIFANVRINEEVFNLDSVDSIFVFPGMSDEGLAVGAAFAKAVTGANPRPFQNSEVQMPEIYLGYGFGDQEIEKALEEAGLAFERFENIEARIAELLVQGYVVARFNGKMEYGPRALGNRSILYHPNDRSVNDWLNKNLKRTEFMPFAPAVLVEAVDKCFVKYQGALDTARFMTITFHCTPWMRDHCAGVVHLDNTARPQVVNSQDNPSFYKIIKEFEKLTDVPVIINTSFNIHEEPIVCTPQDAVRAFQVGHLDYLAIGPYLVKNKLALNHELTPMVS